MADEQMEYFKSEEYIDDLLNHKIHIYDIPFQGRTKSVYIAAYRANCAVWDGSDKANEYRMEMELLGQQARNDILQAMSLGLNSRAESIKMFYKDSYLEFCLTDSKGRRLNYDGGYFQKI